MGREIAATNESQSAASDDADGESARPRSAAPHYSSLATRHALALFLAFLGFYLLTLSGHFYAVDEETLYVQTESIVERGTIALPRGAWGMVLSPGSIDSDGPAYSIFPPGQSVAAVPFYLLGRALTPLFPAGQRGYILRFAVGLLNPFVTAMTVALLYPLARRLGYRGAVAAGLAICYGVATLGWPYSRTFFAEPLTALLLLASFYALRRATEAERPEWCWLVGAGALAALSIPVKPHAAVALPVLGLYLLGRTFARREWRSMVAPALLWGAGMAAVLLPYVAVNLWVFGSPVGGIAAGRSATSPIRS
ncbi:MAG: glycosyltransferase family 39 protein [Chloroflexia bacterium]